MTDVRTRTAPGDFSYLPAKLNTSGLGLDEWYQPAFQAAWWNETRPVRLPLAGGFASSIVDTLMMTDTRSDFSWTALSRRTSPMTLTAARSIAENLRNTAAKITQWADEREYEGQFREVVEPVSGVWLKTLSRFRSGPEIPVSWDDDE